jgi:hypothetical protein
LKIISLRTMSMSKLAVLATGLAAAVLVATVSPAPSAEAHTGDAEDCSGCHTAGGTLVATPSNTTMAAGEAYTVALAFTGGSGNSAYWVTGNGVSLTGSSSSVAMTAPAAAGDYVYTAWTTAGVTTSTTFTITVGGSGPAPTGSTTPVTGTATTTITAPGAPTNVRATAGDGQVNLTWDAPKDDGGSPINGYAFAANGGEASWQGGPGTSGIINGLTNGKSYTFVVMTITDGSGAWSQESLPSNEVTPTGPSASPTTGSAPPHSTTTDSTTTDSTTTGSATTDGATTDGATPDSFATPVVPGGFSPFIPAGSPDTGAGGSFELR